MNTIVSSYRTAVDAAAVFSEADAHGIITYANEQFCRLSGYSQDELIGQNHNILKSGTHTPAFFAHMWQTLRANQVWKGVICNRTKNGQLYWVDSTIIPMLDAAGAIKKFISIRFDISEHRRLIDNLEWRVSRDPLTGGLNRFSVTTTLEAMMEQPIDEASALTVAALDLDAFRSVNNSRGRPAGDELLVRTSKRLESCLGPGEHLARTGSDEFVLLLRRGNSTVAVDQRLRKILDVISAPHSLSSGLLQVTACLGATSFPADEADAPTLLHHAEQALYLAKQSKCNSMLFFDVANDKEIRSRIRTVARLRQALEDGELRLFYQPKVHLRSGDIVGFEALIRWEHPEHGLIPPREFLPEVEQNDLIIEIGEWCMQRALRQAAHWQAAGYDWPISVNIAARHFQRPDFAARLSALMQCEQICRPGALDLEIVETLALHNVDQAAQAIAECRALGVTVSLDDFGTGYSSLIYLQRLKAETIKIDKSFIRHMHESTSDLKLVKAIVNLAKDFKLRVIAEGVETSEQANLLISLGCEVAQGYLYSPAMPIEMVTSWVQARADNPLTTQ